MTSASKRADLTGKRFGWWYVVGYAGQRDGVNYWQCVCCGHDVERIVAEPSLRDCKNDTLDLPCRCQEPLGDLTDHIYGLWTVVALAESGEATSEDDGRRSWRCQCVCGAWGVFTQQALTARLVWSCGCRTEKEVRRERESKQARAFDHVYGRGAYSRLTGAERKKLDHGWTAAMEQALRSFQPKCLLCGVSEDLATHHVRPVSRGHGLRPGNAVRLCLVCNSTIRDREPSELTPHMAAILESGAAQFKEYWEGGCDGTAIRTVTPEVARPKDLDPALVAILPAVDRGEDAAIAALASWLEERGDPRASAIRNAKGDSLPGPAPWARSNEVWGLLGLSGTERETLKQYLSIPSALRAKHTRAETHVQAIRDRNRIDLALHKLTYPTAKPLGQGRHA